MARKKTSTGAFFTNKLTNEEFKLLCVRRPTTQNTHAQISHEDVVKAARKIGKTTKEAFTAWISGGSVSK